MESIYYAENINQRCHIKVVNSSGLCVIRCKDGKYRKALISDLKRIY